MPLFTFRHQRQVYWYDHYTTTSAQAPLLDPNCLDVDELANPLHGEFASMPRILHAPERQARIGRHHLVEKNHSGIEFVDEPFRFRRIFGPSAGAEPEAAVVGDLESVIDILDAKYRRHWAEEFFLVRRR